MMRQPGVFYRLSMMPAIRRICLLVPLLLAWGVVSNIAFAQEQCDNVLAEARDLFYNQVEFDAASNLLERCLQQHSYSEDEIQDIFKLLIQIDLRKGADGEEQLRTHIQNLLTLYPDFQPAPGDPPSLARVIDAYRQEQGEQVDPPVEQVDPVVEDEPVDQAASDAMAQAADQDRITMEAARQGVLARGNEAAVASLFQGAEAERQNGLDQYEAGNYEAAGRSFRSAKDAYDSIQRTLDQAGPPVTQEERPKKGWRKWALIGGGAVLAGVAVMALSGGNGGKSIAPPPPLPGGN